MKQDLKIIKKYYGEKMMQLCRKLFPTLLETEGLLSKLMLDNFAPSRFLYEDIISSNYIISFKNFVYSLNETKKRKKSKVFETPEELLAKAGYKLYECKTEEEIQQFKKYYIPKERLCTFEGKRLNSCYVFFAVKENADKLIRKEFKEPDREDEYGTSVISIQFTKGNVNTLSIKNRYNHTVNNPDATYSNNLENIIEGLTDSFECFYNFNVNQNENNGFELDGYVKASDGRFYKYNDEINNIYYCPNNIIIDNFEVKHFDKEKYIVLDYFILDLVNKKIYIYDKKYELKDSFIDGLDKIEKINIIKNKELGTKQIEIYIPNQEKIIIELNKFNQIMGYKNNNLKEIGNSFLFDNCTLVNLELNNLKEIGNAFLFSNESLKEICLPNVEKIGDDFLYCNNRLINVNLSSVIKIGNYFLCCNNSLEQISLPKLKSVCDQFLSSNVELSVLDLPELEEIAYGFLENNEGLLNLNLPKVRIIGNSFLNKNSLLNSVNMPSLESAGVDFLFENKELISLNLPKLRKVKHNFIFCNKSLRELNLPNLEYIEYGFLYKNNELKQLELPKIIELKRAFLACNKCLEELYAPNLSDEDKELLKINFPNLIFRKEKIKTK